jgi:hypothetical protein
VVLHWRPRQGDPGLCIERLGRFGLLGVRVLDRLSLIQDDGTPRGLRQAGNAQQRAVAGDDQVEPGGVLRRELLELSAVMAEGWTILAFKLGANRFNSAIQLSRSDAGATSRLGCDFAGFEALARFACRTSSSESTWMVLPSPMSSAKQAPSPRPDSKCSHCTPTF